MNNEQFAEMKTMLAGMADHCVKAPHSKHQAPEGIQATNSKLPLSVVDRPAIIDKADEILGLK